MPKWDNAAEVDSTYRKKKLHAGLPQCPFVVRSE